MEPCQRTLLPVFVFLLTILFNTNLFARDLSPANKATPAELKALFSQEVQFLGRINVFPDGTLEGESDRSSSSGKWSINSKGDWCLEWDNFNWPGGCRTLYRIAGSSNKFYYTRPDGREGEYTFTKVSSEGVDDFEARPTEKLESAEGKSKLPPSLNEAELEVDNQEAENFNQNNKLTPSQLKTLFSNKVRYTAELYGAKGVIYPDGTLEGENDRSSSSGKWSINSKGDWCLEWDNFNWSGGCRAMWRVPETPNTYYYERYDGKSEELVLEKITPLSP